METLASPQEASADPLGLGLRLYLDGRHPEAVACYRRALSQSPDDAMTHYVLGLALRAQGRHEQARFEWEAVRECPRQSARDCWAFHCAEVLLAQA